MPSMGRMLARGIAARCAWCGEASVFQGVVAIKPSCPTCGLRFQPESGDWLGAATLSYGVAGAAWIVMLVVWLAVSLPDVAVVPLTIASIGVVVGVGLACSRPAKTTWSALALILSGAHRELRDADAERFGLRR